jgi:hypothetical protein
LSSIRIENPNESWKTARDNDGKPLYDTKS